MEREETPRGRKHHGGRQGWWDYWLLILLCGLVATAAAVALAPMRQPSAWETKLDVRVGRPLVFGDTFTDPAYAERILKTVAEIASTSPVEDAVDSEAPGASLTVEPLRDTELITMSVWASSEQASAAALRSAVDEARRAVDRVYGDGVTFQEISPPGSTLHASPLVLYGVSGLFVGLIIGIGLAWVFAARNRH